MHWTAKGSAVWSHMTITYQRATGNVVWAPLAASDRRRSTMCPYTYTAKRYTYSYTIEGRGTR